MGRHNTDRGCLIVRTIALDGIEPKVYRDEKEVSFNIDTDNLDIKQLLYDYANIKVTDSDHLRVKTECKPDFIIINTEVRDRLSAKIKYICDIIYIGSFSKDFNRSFDI